MQKLNYKIKVVDNFLNEEDFIDLCNLHLDMNFNDEFKVYHNEINNEIKALIPMKRFGKVEEYASLVCFLSSDLSGYITGTSIPIDGGVLKSL